MESKRKYTKTIVQFQSNYRPDQVWDVLTHPKYSAGFTKEPCYHIEYENNEINEDFIMEKGSQWKEIHTEEDCKGDVVVCKIVKVRKNSYLATVRHQAGIKNTTIHTLEENKDGTLITEVQKYSFSLRRFSLVAWIWLATGLLTKLSFNPEDDEFWFENMERELERKYNGV